MFTAGVCAGVVFNYYLIFWSQVDWPIKWDDTVKCSKAPPESA